ncbi:hypothetical protein AVEN_154540-1 [Araneus ventricosus]|uniref:Uncharacterized protein n=1 Tax=Araneus ventricosus TaxID=182803 RepID=A0A4Y2IV17_ARAVE|nr:hypothetical protein AVEN_154540-1 [Araneus ventricosus]
MTNNCEEDTNESFDSLVLSSPANVTTESSRKSSIAIVESFEEPKNNWCVLQKTDAWTFFKNIIFLICVTCLITQAVEFYNMYNKYPTNIVFETSMNNDVKIPAITLCYRNSISAQNFCSDYPDLCEKPNNLEVFCRKHPRICTGNNTALRIPKHGCYTNFSEEVEKIAQRLLLHDSHDDPLPFRTMRSGMEMTTTFVQGGMDTFLKCYSHNLHLYQSDHKPTTLKTDFSLFSSLLVNVYDLQISQLESFYPWGKSQVFFAVHSPFFPINPSIQGHVIKSGVDYAVEEKEERLLPPPYQTNCKDYAASEEANNATNPASSQMCIEICKSEFFKECAGCDAGLTMLPSTDYFCYGEFLGCPKSNNPEEERELHKKRLSCVQKCKPDCLKLHYKYNVVVRGKEFKRKRLDETKIVVFVKNPEVTVVSHVPLYGKGELFSYIGGLMGCWLGISVWTFTDITERFFRKAESWKARLRMKTVQKSPTSDSFQ